MAKILSDLNVLIGASSARRRWQFLGTIILSLAGAVAELVTIGAVIPLIAIASQPERTFVIPGLGVVDFDKIFGAGDAALPAAGAFLAGAAILATISRLLINWYSQKFVFGLHRDLVLTVYSRLLQQPYEWYARQHSSMMLAGIEKIYLVAIGVVAPLMNALTSMILAVFIAAFLVAVNPVAAMVALLVVGGIYGLILFAARKMTAQISAGEAALRTVRIKTLQESVGGIRDILLDRSQVVFEHKMKGIEAEFRRLATASTMISLAPRIVVEGVIIILVTVLAVWFGSQPGGMIVALPAIGALALGTQRLLPLVQLVYFGIVNYSLRRGTIADLVGFLALPEAAVPSGVPMPMMEQGIDLDDVSFRYDDGRLALADISLRIRKGERIGIIGKTGSGKSTLVDVLLGLLPPTEGTISVDGARLDAKNVHSWQSQIAHVPQSIFLSDDTISANIAFGVPSSEVDSDRVQSTIAQAGLKDLIDDLPCGVETIIGERGIRLSGGQRQRIGIARALYKRAGVLILDEATSALDNETETEVMSAVQDLAKDLTVIIVAHRLSTIAECDRVIRLSRGRIAED